MNGQNLALYVAAYSDATSAQADFEALKNAEGDDLKVEAAVVIAATPTAKSTYSKRATATLQAARSSAEASDSSSGSSHHHCLQRPRSAPASAQCSAI